MTTRAGSRSRGPTAAIAEGFSFTGLVMATAATIVLGIALGLVVVGPW
ncbi:hypothetical protein ACIGGF_24395 [Rhodococcus sp. NPDC078407]